MFIVKWGCEDPKHVYQVDSANEKLRVHNELTRLILKTNPEDHGEGQPS